MDTASLLAPRLWDVFQFFIGTNRYKRAMASQAVQAPGRVLEIGCATGNIAQAFAACRYTGIDTEASSIALALHKYRSNPNYSFICGDLFAQPFSPESFDYIVLSHTAHHLPDGYFLKVLVHCRQLLAPGGKLVIIDMVRPAPEDAPGKRFYHWLDRGEFLRTPAEFESVLNTGAGYTNVSCKVVECRKLGVRIIDQVLIEAEK